MANITIKNIKNKDESAHKTGKNLSVGRGCDVNGLNPGALTGAKASPVKFNTMNLPIRGTNLQVSIDAGDEKTFENISSIDAIYMENASNIINESNNSEEEYIPQHYDFEVVLDVSGLVLSPSGEGIVLYPTDTVTLDASGLGYDVYNITIEELTEDFVYNPSWTVFNVIPKGNSFGCGIYNQEVISGSNITIENTATMYECFGLYNGVNGIEFCMFKYYANGNVQMFYDNHTGASSDLFVSIKAICSLNSFTVLMDEQDAEDFAVDNGIFLPNSVTLGCAESDIEINTFIDTYTIRQGDYYHYLADCIILNDSQQHCDLYIVEPYGSDIFAGIVAKPQ